MSKATPLRPPAYRHHKPSGRAVVSIDRVDHYLGEYGSTESRLRYNQLIDAWLRGEAAPARAGDGLTVGQLCGRYLEHAATLYRKHGKPTTELGNVKRAIKGLCECFPVLPAAEFSPKKLKTVRQRFIADGLALVNCNRFVSIIGRVFRWGVEEELVPAGLAHGLEAVKALARGSGVAPEYAEVEPVDQETIDATLPFLGSQVRAMVKIQLLLACRPGELVIMRPCDIDRTGEVWIYKPYSHKTEHRGKKRVIPIGPQAQLLLAPEINSCDADDAFVWPSQRGPHLSVAGYAMAIRTACRRGMIKPWGPNRLRHAGLSHVREADSLDGAQIIAGHSDIKMTQRYAKPNLSKAVAIALRIG